MRPIAAQQTLPFGEAEGSFAERKQALGLALLRVDADLHLAQLMLWIFNATGGGTAKFRKSYEDLAAKPWGLCCSTSTARRRVGEAKRFGWITIEPTYKADGGDGPLEIVIDWEGVRRSHDTLRRPGASGQWSVASGEKMQPASALLQVAPSTVAHGQVEQGGGQADYRGGQPDHAYKEIHLLTPLDTAAASAARRGASAPGADASGSPEWTAAAESLQEAGVERIGPTIALAKSRGTSAAEVIAICGEYRRHAAKLNGPGAIVARLRDGCWPASIEGIDRRRQDRETAGERERGEVEAQRELVQAERVELERLEMRYGRDVDGAPEERLVEMLEAGGDGVLVPMLRKFGRSSAIVRRRLLELVGETMNAER